MPQHILLVDDEYKITELARLYLENEGYRVTAVYDGQSALDVIRIDPPHLVVLDLMVPFVDGYEVCRRVRATSDLPIIPGASFLCSKMGWLLPIRRTSLSAHAAARD